MQTKIKKLSRDDRQEIVAALDARIRWTRKELKKSGHIEDNWYIDRLIILMLGIKRGNLFI